MRAVRALSGVGAALVAWGGAPLAAPVSPAPASPAPVSAAVWKTIAPGAERGVAGEGDRRLEMFRFDLERYRAEVVVASDQRPPHARVWLPGSRHTAAEVLRQLGGGGGGGAGVIAVVNGGFFDQSGRSLGLRIAGGEAIVPLRPNVDWGVLVVGGRRARIVHSRDFVAAPAIDAAIQVGPRILIEGAVPRLKPQSARRSAVALDGEGRMLTLVIAPQAVEAAELATRLAALGFHSALLLDGGPSTQLAVGTVTAGAASRTKPAPGGGSGGVAQVEVQIPGAYPVPDLLAIVPR